MHESIEVKCGTNGTGGTGGTEAPMPSFFYKNSLVFHFSVVFSKKKVILSTIIEVENVALVFPALDAPTVRSQTGVVAKQ